MFDGGFISSSRWNEMVSAYGLKPGQTVWIFQAGWDIDLAQELQEKVPEFHDLKSESFGRNISLVQADLSGISPSCSEAKDRTLRWPTRWFSAAETCGYFRLA